MLAHNVAGIAGGGVWSGPDGTLSLTRVTFRENQCEGGAGGGLANASPLTATDTTFVERHRAERGGALANAGAMTGLFGCTFIGNSSARNGGAISDERAARCGS